MKDPVIRYHPLGAEGARAELRLPDGRRLTITWRDDGSEPTFGGDSFLLGNEMLGAALFAYVLCTKRAHVIAAMTPRLELAAGAEPEAAGKSVAKWVGMLPHIAPRPKDVSIEEYLDRLLAEAGGRAENAERGLFGFARALSFPPAPDLDVVARCSGCLQISTHRCVEVSEGWDPVFYCDNCGLLTTPCTHQDCPHMAVRGHQDRVVGMFTAPFCAEHAGELPSFEAVGIRISSLADWRDLLTSTERPLLPRPARGVGPLDWLVHDDPVVAAALGTRPDEGEARTTDPLDVARAVRMLSTAVEHPSSGPDYDIESPWGLRHGMDDLRSDKRFELQMVREGTGPTVIFSSGFTTAKDKDWQRWQRIINTKFPDSPVWRVRWNSAARPSLPGWITASRAALRAGEVLAVILSRMDDPDGFVLLGHSLGGALMGSAASHLASMGQRTPVIEAHLLGAAIPRNRSSADMAKGVRDRVFNYFSAKDPILDKLFGAGNLNGIKPAGAVGFDDIEPRVLNIDVHEVVGEHSAYMDVLSLAR